MSGAVVVMREKAAAETLGVSAATLRSWRVSGRGPAFRRLGGRLIVYTDEDLREYLERCRRTSTSDKGEPAKFGR